MSAPGLSHDLLVSPADARGEVSADLDRAWCADLARTLAQLGRAWAGEAKWKGLGGFSPTGGFWLAPDQEQSEMLSFQRSAQCEGWLRAGSPDDDRVSAHFPVAEAPPELAAPLSFATLHHAARALPGFGGCALRHPVTGLWKPVITAPEPNRLALATRSFTPLSRIIASQGLPVGRILLLSDRSAAFVWRTPGKIFGYLQVYHLDALARAAGLVDALLLCTARADLD